MAREKSYITTTDSHQKPNDVLVLYAFPTPQLQQLTKQQHSKMSELVVDHYM